MGYAGSSVVEISFSVGESGEEIARNIADRAIEKAVREKNVDDLTTIADELEMSLEFDDLAEEVREIIVVTAALVTTFLSTD